MQEEIVKIFSEYDKTGTNTWDYKIASHDLSYQIGKLTKGVLQLKGDRYKEGLSEEEIEDL